MANIKISALPTTGTLLGTHIIPFVDTASNTTKTVTAQVLLNYITGSTFNTFVTSGDVGIGINPTQKLHVAGETLINGGGSLRLQSVTPGNDGMIKFIEPAGTLRSGIYYAGTDLLRIADATTDRLVIDSSGDVGIGTNGPQTKLHVSGGSGILVEAVGAQWAVLGSNVAASNYMTLRRPGTTAALGYIGGGAGGSIGAGTEIDLAIRSEASLYLTTNGAVPQIIVDTSGNTTIANGNIIFGTSGKGIDFSITPNSGTTSPAELFDDYEEGTWTPAFSGSTTAGAYTYGVTGGTYTKIGKVVNFTCFVAATATTTAATGTIFITGVPFLLGSTGTGVSTYGDVSYYVLNTPINRLSWTSNPSETTFNILRNVVPESSLTTALTASSANELGSTPGFRFSGFYFTDQ